MSQSYPPSTGGTHDSVGSGQGAPALAGYPGPATPPTNKAATASLVLSIISLFAAVLFVPALVGLILGIVGLRKAGSTTPPIGRGKAVAGIVMSVVSFVLGAALVGALTSGDDDTGATSEPAASISQDADSEMAQDDESASDEDKEAEPVQEDAAEEPAEEPAVEPEPVEPAMTVSQEQAVASAQSYIDLTPFSQSGLIEQLVFEKYSEADAQFAVEYIEVDWKEQAALSAENYLEMTAFSREGLIDQLVFEGFTEEQATYGVDQMGL
jgi:hypothetical protein